LGTVHSTSAVTAASNSSSPAGSASARPSTTRIGTGADRAAACAVERRRGVGEHQAVAGADLDHPAAQPCSQGAAVFSSSGAVHLHAELLVDAGEDRMSHRLVSSGSGSVPFSAEDIHSE
jgi:hypothetical protein